ncbi:MAG: M15 family metallopeptidase [Bdellovibrionales bacterium]|nr:M15 family metallopeptidase [Bdellovibrionales bacterium]
MAKIPPGFVSLADVCPTLKIEMSYSSADNFTGEVVAGYKAKKAYLAEAPAMALCLVQAEAQKLGLSLKIFDGYRPVKAVAFFQLWAQRPETNPHLKEMYYPGFTRLQLFDQGYIAKRSSHSRGSAVDLTLVETNTGKSLDMGSAFDYFHELSSTESPHVTEEQKRNRLILRSLMEEKGFKNFSQEWWHYSFKPEPYPDQYFDFDVE